MGWEKLGGALEALQGDVLSQKRREIMRPNPHLKCRNGGFTTGDIARTLSGWDTTSNSIDYYLATELEQLRARSRKMVRANPLGKRFVGTLKTNIVGHAGVTVQAQTKYFDGSLDTKANESIERAFLDWGSKDNCDYIGKHNWVAMQNLAIGCAGQDGEFLFLKHKGKGKYGYQLQILDPQLLDTQKNTETARGKVRLGIEYNKAGKVVRYHFRKQDALSGLGSDRKDDTFSHPAERIIHGFIPEWVDQSRGVPWMHASLENSKHLEKFNEAAIVNARAGASTMAFISGDSGDAYSGEEEAPEYGDGVTLDSYEAGTIKDIGDKTITQIDPAYPHQMYSDFVKTHLRSIASGLGVSYHTLSNDLEGVNYSSIRAGVLEDREVFKGLQGWFIDQLIRPVFMEWLPLAIKSGHVRIGGAILSRNIGDYKVANFQGRRWPWVDPQKDGAANQLAIDNRTKSISQIVREEGGDPETVFREIQRERELMAGLGIMPESKNTEEADADED